MKELSMNFTYTTHVSTSDFALAMLLPPKRSQI